MRSAWGWLYANCSGIRAVDRVYKTQGAEKLGKMKTKKVSCDTPTSTHHKEYAMYSCLYLRKIE